MAFGRRTRTQSAQAGFGESDPIAEFGANSALSSASPSPMASNTDLPHGMVMDNPSRRPSADELSAQPQKGRFSGRSRTNSISSVTGSLRRVLTTTSLATLGQKRSQADAAKSMGGSVQRERQLAMSGLQTPLTESAPSRNTPESIPEGSESSRKTGSNTLRRSRTMLDYSKSWFRASAAANVVERVHAEAVAPVQGSQRRPSSTSITTTASSSTSVADSGVARKDLKPLRAHSTPVTRQTPVHSEAYRRASDTQLATISEQHRGAGDQGGGVRRVSRGFNPLRFLQNNRISPLPSKNGA